MRRLHRNKSDVMLTRVRRAAKRVPRGMEILAWLQRPELVQQLLTTANNEEPPVGAIAQQLLDEFGEAVRALNIRQFIGMAVSQIMQQNNYVMDQRGIRMRNPLFVTGATYKPASTLPPEIVPKLSWQNQDANGDSLALRFLLSFIDALTPEEELIFKQKLLPILQRRIAEEDAQAKTTDSAGK